MGLRFPGCKKPYFDKGFQNSPIGVKAVEVIIPYAFATGWTNSDRHEGSYGTWDGEKWNSTFTGSYYMIDLAPLGNWHEDYRPTTVRVTATDGIALVVWDADDQYDRDILNSAGNPFVSGQDYTFVWASYDIGSLWMINLGGSFSITNIEFDVS